jgi:hypothetical protein
LYSSPIIIRTIKSRRMRWAWAYITSSGEERCIQVFGGGNFRERDNSEDPGIDGKIILKLNFRK